MTITRNGMEIVLTADEIRSLIADEHKKDIRYEVECATKQMEEDGEISFNDYETVGFADYSSSDDARSDFIDKLTEDILEREEMYSNDSSDHVTHDFTNEVLDFADDIGYRKGV